MPKRVSRNPLMTDDQLQELFSKIKPVYRIDEQWLTDQRYRLMGALEVAEEGYLLGRIGQRLSLWWEELPYVWVAARPAMALVSAALVGILVGRFLLMAPAAPGATLAGTGESGAPQMDLAEMIRAGEVKGIDVGLSDDPDNPVELTISIGHKMKLTGSAEREDILAALEYVLVKDPNPGQRLQSARILGNSSRLGEKASTIMALVSALLTDDNPGVRISVIKSLRGVRNPLVKDALIKTVLEDANEGVRRAAVDNMSYFLTDLSVRSALLLVSRMDPIETVRYQAYQVLSEAPEGLYDESLDSQQ
ncbi:MAG: HEAT repeat domain-containing protein [Candidatus Marinimicrobia bacterium]|nr:HEAT repeat domain-containing protein [Candidatus Neomarinimicrobiota bacterium]